MAKQKLDPAQVQRDLERFAAAVKESEKAERATRDKQRAAKLENDRQVAASQAQQRALADAQRALAQAVEAVRRAKQHGKGRAEADAAWKAAKARVIELETGVAPSWAPRVAEPGDPSESSESSDSASRAGDESADASDARTDLAAADSAGAQAPGDAAE